MRLLLKNSVEMGLISVLLSLAPSALWAQEFKTDIIYLHRQKVSDERLKAAQAKAANRDNLGLELSAGRFLEFQKNLQTAEEHKKELKQKQANKLAVCAQREAELAELQDEKGGLVMQNIGKHCYN